MTMTIGLAILFGFLCWAIFYYAMSIPTAAGAGAVGSIFMAISGVFGLACVFTLGVSLGLVLHL